MTEHEEQLAALRAVVDQAAAHAPELARVVASYYMALRAEGVPDHAATQIVVGWQAVLFGLGAQQLEDEEEA